MDCSKSVFPVHHHLPELAQTQVLESVIPSNHLILCFSLLFLPSVFPSNRAFANELALCIRWPKYCSFIFSTSPSNEYSGILSFRIDWFALLAVQGTLEESSATPEFESINFEFTGSNYVRYLLWGLLRWLRGKESTWNAGDTYSISGSGRSTGEENGNSLQYSNLGNSMA